jgi:hypothetical protein
VTHSRIKPEMKEMAAKISSPVDSSAVGRRGTNPVFKNSIITGIDNIIPVKENKIANSQ